MPRRTRAQVALAEHATSVAATRDDRSCYRQACHSPGAVRFLHSNLRMDTACEPHGRDLWRGFGGSKAESSGRFTWWRLGVE